MTDTVSPTLARSAELAAARDDAVGWINIGAVWKWAVLLGVTVAVLVPLLATLLGGFKSLGELRTDPVGLPDVWVWQNYWEILSSYRYWELLFNSLWIAGFTVALNLIVASMAAFAFAHLHFFERDFLFNYLLLGLTFPFATAILPLFIKVRDLGLLNTHWGVILPQVAFGLGVSVLLLRNAFRRLPEELLDAALVDGCGYMRFFFYVTLPLSRPILATVAIISFVASWNNFLLPLVVLNSEVKYPWPLGMMVYQGEYMTNWPLVLAFVTLTILPAILMFVLAQKHIVSGLTAGAVKG